MEKFNSRVKAMFAADSFATKSLREAIRRANGSALNLSKYLTVLYSASFVFFISSLDKVTQITGGRGPALWTMALILFCLVIEAFRTVKLYIGRGAETYFESIEDDLHECLEALDTQGKQDFFLFLDQLSEKYSAHMFKFPIKINIFKKMIEKSKAQDEEARESNEQKSEYLKAVENVISTAEKAKKGIWERTLEKSGLFKQQFAETLTAHVLSSLVFFLYLLSLSIIVVCALVANYQTMFSGILPLLEQILGWIHRMPVN